MPRVDQATTQRDNNFNLIRMVAAGSVLVSHAYPLALGPGSPEPLDRILGMDVGTLAVISFFVISGYFISQSFHRGIIEFAVARILRIYPGLVMVLLLTVFAIGPIFTKLDIGAYFSDRETFLYMPRNLSLGALRYDLPGVFEDNPYPRAINGSLWTLFYEVACYAMVAVVGILGLTASGRRFVGFLTTYALFYAAVLLLDLRHHVLDHATILRNAHQLTLPFVIGMAFFQFRRRLPLRLPVLGLAIAAAILSYDKPWFHQVFVLAWSYGLFYLGFLRCEPILYYNMLGDYSYGVYIFAFPIEQMVAALCKGCAPLALMALSFPFTLLLAVLSWHFIEEPALSQKSAVSGWLRRVAVSGQPAPR